MLVKILAQAFERSEDEIRKRYKKIGDLGEVGEQLGEGGKQKDRLTVEEVYQKLREIAEVSGAGSQERKTQWMATLLKELTPLSIRYIVRIPLAKLRLGFSDKTILDALSVMEAGDKSLRGEIERAYNVSADIGKIAQLIKVGGVRGLRKIKIDVGIPVRMAAAERLPTPEAILKKMGGKLAAEPKYDGFHIQIHLDKKRKLTERESSEQLSLLGKELGGPWVKIFSRNLEDATSMFPEVVEAMQKLPAREVILEGEAIAYNPETEEFAPFQETAKRKRKYGIKEKASELPLKVFAFDLLYLEGKDLTQEPYEKRRKVLEKLLKGADQEVITATEVQILTSAKKLGEFFMEQVEHGLEGLMTKRLEGVYQAGVRNFNWVKLKRVEKGELQDTIDVVVLGYYRGRGKRAQFGIGGFLVAVYDEGDDTFKTISRVGSGLKDEEWEEMKRRIEAVKIKNKPKNAEVVKELTPDVWAAPEIVVSIRADEITRSPLHTAGRRGDQAGLALRFPRLIAFRDEKRPEQVTTVGEVENFFKQQKKR